MKSNIAKPLQQAAGKALVEWVLDTAEETGSDENIVVIGHKAEDVKSISWGQGEVCLSV